MRDPQAASLTGRRRLEAPQPESQGTGKDQLPPGNRVSLRADEESTDLKPAGAAWFGGLGGSLACRSQPGGMAQVEPLHGCVITKGDCAFQVCPSLRRAVNDTMGKEKKSLNCLIS